MNNSNNWQNILQPEEIIKHQFSLSPRFLKFGLLVSTILSLPLMFLYGLGILTALIALFYFGFYLRMANNYIFTNKRIIARFGWLNIETISIDYNKVTDIKIKEPFFDRFIIGSGHLIINTAGSDKEELVLQHLDNPQNIKQILETIKNA